MLILESLVTTLCRVNDVSCQCYKECVLLKIFPNLKVHFVFDNAVVNSFPWEKLNIYGINPKGRVCQKARVCSDRNVSFELCRHYFPNPFI